MICTGHALRVTGYKVSIPEAKEWFEKAAAKHHKKACRNLGKILYGGIGGVAVDQARARVLLQQAADLGVLQCVAVCCSVLCCTGASVAWLWIRRARACRCSRLQI